ncbi:major facilitator superfamily domain-containing protein [Mrakia frigida]|uniref:MFS transporter n=1 Tax=Mrakia frigida TaxID=29902 RepID=UPI003FCC25F2
MSLSSSASEYTLAVPDLEKNVSGTPGPYGTTSPGEGDSTGLPPPHSAIEAVEEQAGFDEKDGERVSKGDPDWEVRFEEGDVENPMNWSMRYRWYLVFTAGLLVLNATFASSAPTGVLSEMKTIFGMSDEVSILVLSLFVAGYVIGPLFWGPLSEVYGRRPPLIVAFALYVGFQVGSALAPNTTAVLIFRLLGGICASSPIVVTGGQIGDLFEPRIRGLAISIFVLAPTVGPAIGPIIGGYMGDAGVRWSALYWLLCAFAAFCLLVIVFTIPETYAPVILVQKAKRLRKETGEPWFAPLERKQTGIKARVNDVCVRPFAMLVEEPMLAAICCYMSTIYGIMYLNFVAFPIIFQGTHGFRAGPSGLMFLPFLFGSVAGTSLSALYYNPKYIRDAAVYPSSKVPPELRLNSAYIGAPLLPISILWLGFTSYPSIHWAVPMMSGCLMGFALSLIFLPLMNYIVDTYIYSAATALSAATVIRSIAGAVFPLFGKTMYTALTAPYACLILAVLCMLLMPLPFIFKKFGPRIRGRSKNARLAAEAMAATEAL